MKTKTLMEVKDFLESENYSTFVYPRGCFDIAARREDMLLLKVLTNVDSFQKEQARDLKLLSSLLESNCFVLGRRTRRQNLRDSVVYERFGIPAMTPGTFMSTVRGRYPKKISTRGGVFGVLDPDRLRNLRREKDLTQQELADMLGVSQKSISEHESRRGKVVVKMLEALENIFEEELTERIDPFQLFDAETSRSTEKGKGLCRILRDIGFNASSVKRAPPELVARSEKTVISKQIRKNSHGMEKLSEFSEVTNSTAFVVSDKDKYAEGLPYIRRDEIQEIGSPKELIKIVEERSAA